MITIAGTRFARSHYDSRGDVLYLTTEGYKGPPADALSTAEGHNVEFDETGQPIAMTIVNARWYLERDGVLKITLPLEHLTSRELAALGSPALRVSEAELAPALRSIA